MEEKLGIGRCLVALFGAGGMDSGSGAGMTGGKVDKCEGKGTDCGSGGGMTGGKVDKCEGRGWIPARGGMTRVREIGDWAKS